MAEASKKTALFDWHQNAGAKMVSFGGWLMPVSYSGVLQEHHAVRSAAGIFDVSHMGEFFVKGPHAAAFLNLVTMNDVTRLNPGQGQYSAMLLDCGGIIDDLIVYQLSADHYLLCVNASNIDKDFSWLEAQLKSNALKLPREEMPTLTDDSDQWSQYAVQGPKAAQIMEKAVAADQLSQLTGLDYMEIREITLMDTPCLIARSGYTGEFGYEIYLPKEASTEIWCHLLELGTPDGLSPCGLGARDTLRLEACYPLYGNDLDADINPFEAGLKWAVRMHKPQFVGKESLEQLVKDGVKRATYAFVMQDQGIARHGMAVYLDGAEVGRVTSGSVLPTIGGAGGLALLEKLGLSPDQEVEIDVRGKRKLARIVKRPLYSPRVR